MIEPPSPPKTVAEKIPVGITGREWAPEAFPWVTWRIWLRVGSAAPVTRELHTAARERGAVTHQGYTARLLRLDPPRVAGRVPRPEDYRASFEIAPGSGAPPEMRWAGAEVTGGATEGAVGPRRRPAPTPDAGAWQR